MTIAIPRYGTSVATKERQARRMTLRERLEAWSGAREPETANGNCSQEGLIETIHQCPPMLLSDIRSALSKKRDPDQ